MTHAPLTRRRFLTVTAAAVCLPAAATAQSWQGRAFGADIALTLEGPAEQTRPALEAARKIIREVEDEFSLYDPASSLSRLNATGQLTPSPRFHALMQHADRAYHDTGGLFDATIQPLWRALAEGRDPQKAATLIGWHRVAFDDSHVQLATGQALSFNGIAQGFATDLVTASLKAHGLTETLVNIGEFRAQGGPWQLGVSDPVYGMLARRSLSEGAIATSSPCAMQLGTRKHILHPTAAPHWSTVSVEAATATQADALSTAMVLMPEAQIRQLKQAANLRRILLVDGQGNLSSL